MVLLIYSYPSVYKETDHFLYILPVLCNRKGCLCAYYLGRYSIGIEAIYHRPGRVVMGVVLHFAAWIIGAAETWVGAALLGHPLLAWEVLVVESLVYALRTAVFFIPSGLGVQEGGYVAVGALFGLDPQSALALSILKRGRDLLLAVPALLWWQAVEGKRFWVSRARPPRHR